MCPNDLTDTDMHSEMRHFSIAKRDDCYIIWQSVVNIFC